MDIRTLAGRLCGPAVILVALMAFPNVAEANSVFDDFDDPDGNSATLDPAWVISTTNAAPPVAGVDFVEAGSSLTVNDILGVPGGNSGFVRFTQTFNPLASRFQSTVTVAWDSFGDPTISQTVGIELRDGSGGLVASAQMRDNRDSGGGFQVTNIGGTQSVGALQPTTGTATIEIIRDNAGVVTILWDGAVLQTGTIANPIEEVSLVFGTLNDATLGLTGFGQASVGLVQVTTPEPGSIFLALLAGSGALLLDRRRRRHAVA